MSIVKLFCVVLVLQLLVSPVAWAQSVGGSGGTGSAVPVNLDLGSTDKSLTAGHLVAKGPVAIVVGGQQQIINSSSQLTPAERLAAYQVLSTGQQSIQVGALGNAIGGSFTMGAKFSQYVSGIVIPQGVTAVKDFAKGSTLNLVGNLTNAGTFYAVSTNPAVSTAVINAANIYNQQGALLTSVLPAGGLLGMTNVIASLNLTLNAVQNIVNAGRISSSGSLSATAGGSITNTNTAVMQALSNVNLVSQIGSFVNAGMIASQMANINFSTGQLVRDMTVNNAGGTIQALNGAINMRDSSFNAVANLNINGGDFISKELNLHSGQGDITASLGKVTGEINGQGHGAHIYASTPTLTLGNLCMTGDPTFVNDGDIDIVGLLDVTSSGEDLALVAGGNITATGPGAQIVNHGGKIVLIAGAGNSGSVLCSSGCGTPGPIPDPYTFPIDLGATVTVSSASDNGGYIDFRSSTSASGYVIDSSSTGSGEPGGDVTLVAMSGASLLHAHAYGWIWFPTGAGNPASINTAASGSGIAGNVVIHAGAIDEGPVLPPASVALGGVETGGGSLTITTAQPTFTGLSFNSSGVQTGSINAGTIINNVTVEFAQPVHTYAGTINVRAGTVIIDSTGVLSTSSSDSQAIAISALTEINSLGIIQGTGTGNIYMGAPAIVNGGTIQAAGNINIASLDPSSALSFTNSTLGHIQSTGGYVVLDHVTTLVNDGTIEATDSTNGWLQFIAPAGGTMTVSGTGQFTANGNHYWTECCGGISFINQPGAESFLVFGDGSSPTTLSFLAPYGVYFNTIVRLGDPVITSGHITVHDNTTLDIHSGDVATTFVFTTNALTIGDDIHVLRQPQARVRCATDMHIQASSLVNNGQIISAGGTLYVSPLATTLQQPTDIAISGNSTGVIDGRYGLFQGQTDISITNWSPSLGATYQSNISFVATPAGSSTLIFNLGAAPTQFENICFVSTQESGATATNTLTVGANVTLRTLPSVHALDLTSNTTPFLFMTTHLSVAAGGSISNSSNPATIPAGQSGSYVAIVGYTSPLLVDGAGSISSTNVDDPLTRAPVVFEGETVNVSGVTITGNIYGAAIGSTVHSGASFTLTGPAGVDLYLCGPAIPLPSYIYSMPLPGILTFNGGISISATGAQSIHINGVNSLTAGFPSIIVAGYNSNLDYFRQDTPFYSNALTGSGDVSLRANNISVNSNFMSYGPGIASTGGNVSLVATNAVVVNDNSAITSLGGDILINAGSALGGGEIFVYGSNLRSVAMYQGSGPLYQGGNIGFYAGPTGDSRGTPSGLEAYLLSLQSEKTSPLNTTNLHISSPDPEHPAVYDSTFLGYLEGYSNVMAGGFDQWNTNLFTDLGGNSRNGGVISIGTATAPASGEIEIFGSGANVTFTAILPQPATPPVPTPVIYQPNPIGPEPTPVVIVIPTRSGDPIAIPTDKTPPREPGRPMPQPLAVTDLEAITGQFFVSGSPCTLYECSLLGGSQVQGQPGAIFSVKPDKTFVLTSGRMLAGAGEKGLTVQLGSSRKHIMLKGKTIAIVDAQSKAGVRVTVLSGDGPDAVSVGVGDETLVALRTGEEALLVDQGDNEELIPVDGVERLPIGGSVTKLGLTMQKASVPVDKLVKREPLLTCCFGVPGSTPHAVCHESWVAKRLHQLYGGKDEPAISQMAPPVGKDTRISSAGSDLSARRSLSLLSLI